MKQEYKNNENSSRLQTGYIKLHRSLMHDELYLSEPFTKTQAFIDLILRAEYKPRGSSFTVRDCTVFVKRGEVAISQEILSRKYRWSRGKLIRYLNLLEKQGKIVQQKGGVINLISICNYDKYQADGTTDDTTGSTTGGTHPRNKRNKEKDLMNF